MRLVPGKALYLRTGLLVTVAVVIANVAGAAVVFGLAAWVVPNPPVEDSYETRVLNLVAAGIYVTAGVIVGMLWGARELRASTRWLRAGRPSTREEQWALLRLPVRIARLNAWLWAGAVPVFVALNAFISVELALRVVAVTVALGGITTVALAHRLAGRALRPITASVLADGLPDRPAASGVVASSLLAWGLGTAVPVVGLMFVALGALVQDDVTRTQLAITMLGLGGAVLVVGLLLAVLAARATADPVVSVREALARVERGELDTEVPVYDGSELGLLQAGFNRMVVGLREREQLREALGTYVDHDVAERILTDGVSPGGEEVEVTAMFVDVRDFSALAASLPAGEVVALLNELFERIVPVVHAHGGYVDKFVGDGLLAVFGAPRRDPEHADNALGAALDLVEAAERLGDRLRIGVGLSSGPVLAGNVGGAGRLEFSVIGDAVNVAARVEAATRRTGDAVLLSSETAARLRRSAVELVGRPSLTLPGRSQPVELLAPGTSAARRRTARAPR